MKIAATAILLALPFSAYAKCVDERYSIEGRVVDEHGKPISGAVIGASWTSYAGDPRGPALTKSGDDGRYILTFNVSRYSGSSLSFSDSCDYQVKEVSVSASHSRMKTWPMYVRISGARTVVKEMQISFPSEMPWH